MWKTVVFLIFTLIVVPIVAFNYDEIPSYVELIVLHQLLWVYAITTIICFVVSTISKNYSQVDKLWSIMPMIYAWIVAVYSDYDARVVIMAILVTIWGLRLTFNFARRGGYQWKFWLGEEDYRWAVLMNKPEFQPHWKWMIFNFFFISFYQMGLILLFTIPIVKGIGGGPITIWDIFLTILIIGAILLETISDQQQWTYQVLKAKALQRGNDIDESYQKGFLDKGLWGVVRHPNYAAEQSVWLLFYFFSVVATGIWINWSITGCLLLVILFKGSSDFSEEISEQKYKGYRDYKNKVPRFIPRFRFFKK